MALGYIGSIPSPILQSIVDMRRRLDDLQRQLGSGQKSTNYAGLGLDRGISVSLRRQLDTTASFDSTITSVGVRMSVAQTALSGVSSLTHTIKGATQEAVFAIDQSGQTGQQRAALTGLNQLVALLNSRAGDRYLFSGQAIDRQSVASADLILNGDATHAGLKQIIDERRQADLGANELGRLDLNRVGTDVTLDEDGAHTFGFKLTGASSTLTNATLTAPAGSPAGMSVDFTGIPAAGGSVTIDVTLPDGSTRSRRIRRPPPDNSRSARQPPTPRQISRPRSTPR
jgi:flagellar hook-associated protein 3 FlgL